jgi:DNA polymerase-1
MPTERLVLVDGSWLVFRAFFAIPSNLKTRTGLHTNAIFGFATMFRKLFAGRKPDRGAVVFDPPGLTIREQRFPQYKAQRPPLPAELREQLPWIDRVVEAHHFPILRVAGYEADDVIGTLARRGVEAGMEVILVAGDKDLAQLVGDGIRMHDTMKDVVYDAELVRKKWGVPPSRIPDLLALMGDEVDNIPGVPGIGAKGAAQLIEQYGTIEAIVGHLGELKGRQRAAIEEHLDALLLYRDLARVDTHVPLPVDLDDLRIRPPDPGELDALYRELEFYSLLTGGDEKRARDMSTSVVRCLTRSREAREAIAALPRDRDVAVVPVFEPIERVVRGRLVGLAIAAEPGHPFYLPMAGRGEHLGEEGFEIVRPLLEDPSRPKVVHDVKQLAILLRRRQCEIRGPVLDTMLASFLIDPSRCVPHRLDQVAKEYVQRGVPWMKAFVGSGQHARAPSEATVEEAAQWAGQHADVVLALAPVLRERLEREGQRAHYERIELPLASVLASMELTGIRVDPDDLARMSEEFQARKVEIEKRIYELAGREFNIGSTKQLADVLFEHLKLPVVKKTKTGYSTDAEVLERLATKHEIARLILHQRELSKLIHTYTEGLRRAVDPQTGRVHAQFLQTAAVSGRLVTTEPDLQHTPTRTPEGKRIRKAFVAPEGRVVIAADWNQIELRVLAHFSRDPRLLEAFEQHLDLHRRTAAMLFGISPESVSAEQRNIGKTVNFATIYGQGATALGQVLGIPRKDAQRYIDQYFEHYAGVRAWLDRTIEEAHRNGYVTTILGRRRYIAELSALNATDRAAGERIAVNTPIQGSAADLCKLAMLEVARRLPEVAPNTRMVLQVHDELVFEAPEDEVEAASEVIRRVMERPYPGLAVPLSVEIGVGRSWGDAK